MRYHVVAFARRYEKAADLAARAELETGVQHVVRSRYGTKRGYEVVCVLDDEADGTDVDVQVPSDVDDEGHVL